ncbi:MAG: hypothetical protein MUP45_00145 [Candidatus Marinimicrobia bacterium]|nr:hypothetical protein [Candidatus Neomarinimicrobiota bacterium]
MTIEKTAEHPRAVRVFELTEEGKQVAEALRAAQDVLERPEVGGEEKDKEEQPNQ